MDIQLILHEKELQDKWSRHWFQYILDHPEKPWVFNCCIIENSNLTWTTILANWNIFQHHELYITRFNPNFTFDHYLELYAGKNLKKRLTYNVLNFYMTCFMENPNFDIYRFREYKMRIVEQDLKCDDYCCEMEKRSEASFKDFARSAMVRKWEMSIQPIDIVPNLNSISRNPNIPLSYIQANLDTWPNEWDYNWLSANPNLTIEFIRKNISKPWNWWYICDYSIHKRTFLTWDIIRSNLDLPWEWEVLSSHPCITFDIVQQHPQFAWSMDFLGKNPNVDWNCIQSHPMISWNYMYVSENPNITLDIVLANRHLSWDYPTLSRSLNITWQMVEDHPDFPWDYHCLLLNPMDAEKHSFMTKIWQEWFVKSDLHRELIEYLWHPRRLFILKANGHDVFDDAEETIT